MTTPKRIGVFGGTFDPIHNAHIKIAHAAIDSADLDEVLFVISASPPHKQDHVCASAEQRYAMVESALEAEEKLYPSDIEMARSGPSYTVTTLDELANQYPDAHLFLILGLDSLVDIPNWKQPDKIYELAHILAVTRGGETRSISDDLVGKYDIVPFKESQISSTLVREKMKAGESLRNIVPHNVIAMIEQGNLYE